MPEILLDFQFVGTKCGCNAPLIGIQTPLRVIAMVAPVKVPEQLPGTITSSSGSGFFFVYPLFFASPCFLLAPRDPREPVDGGVHGRLGPLLCPGGGWSKLCKVWGLQCALPYVLRFTHCACFMTYSCGLPALLSSASQSKVMTFRT